jgi:small conductance mechanosensitive channel
MSEQNVFDFLIYKLTSWGSELADVLPYLLVALLIQVLFVIAAKISKVITFKVMSKFHTTLAVNKLVANFVLINMIIGGFIVAMSVLQLDRTVTSVLAAGGIIGLALGLAFQDLVLNIISGVLIAIRKPFNIGDLIETKGVFGEVVDIRLRTVEILNRNGQFVFIPSRDVSQTNLMNFSMLGKRRIVLDLRISYSEDLERIKQITLDAIKTVPELLTNEAVELFYTEFSESSIKFMVRFWIKFQYQREYRKAVSDAMMAIKVAYDNNNITIPFPITTMIIDDEKINIKRKEE